MENIIKNDTVDVIATGVNRYLRSIDAHMEIYQLNTHRCRRGEVLQFGVNWAACGTVQAEEAKRFADVLNHAAHICEVLNAYHWTEVYEDAYDTAEGYYGDIARIFDGLTSGNDIKELVDAIL